MASYTGINLVNDQINYFKQANDLLARQNATQTRLTKLNDGYRKRYSKIVEMLAVVVLGFVVILILRLMQRKFGVGETIVNGISYVVISIIALYLVLAIVQLTSRSQMNYDELDLQNANASVPSEEAGSAASTKGLTTGEMAPCADESCCVAPMVWDNNKKICIANYCSTNTVWDPTTSTCLTSCSGGYTAINHICPKPPQ